MYSNHKRYIALLFVCSLVVFYQSDVKIYDYITQNLITFFSIAFGFYITSIAVLYNADFTRKLYCEIDSKKPIQRKIHTIKNYFQFSSMYSVFSIICILIYSILATKNSDGRLEIKHSVSLNIMNSVFEFSVDRWLSSVILSVSAVNILIIFIVIKIFMSGFIHEAKIKSENQP